MAWKKDTLQLFPAKDCTAILPKDVNPTSVNIKIDKPDYVNASIKAGQKIGTATLSYANNDLMTVDLISTENVNRSNILFTIYIIKNIINSIWFKIALILSIILIVFYVVYMIKINKNNKKKRKIVKAKKYK